MRRFITRTYKPDLARGCDWALICISDEDVKVLLARRKMLQEMKQQECATDIRCINFWGGGRCWFLNNELRDHLPQDDGEERSLLEDLLNEQEWWDSHEVWEGVLIEVPEDFVIDDGYVARTEIDTEIVMEDGVLFTAYPKHVDYKVEASTLWWALIT